MRISIKDLVFKIRVYLINILQTNKEYYKLDINKEDDILLSQIN